MQSSALPPLASLVLHRWYAPVLRMEHLSLMFDNNGQAAFTQRPQMAEWHVSAYVTTLGISLYVEGLGLGPLLLGPLSEFYGRNAVYWSSFGCL